MADAHTADAIGARDVRGERDDQDRAETAQHGRPDAPRPVNDSVADGDMMLTVRELVMTLVPLHEPSTYVPSSAMFFQTLHNMDDIMLTNRYWQNRSVAWTPIMSRIYFGTLFIMQILRCMENARILTPSQRELLQQFSEDFPFESLPIPGPLIPFFRSLATCMPYLSEYGIVTPSLPNRTGATLANGFTLNGDIRVFLPSLPALRVAARRTRQTVNNVAQQWDFNLISTADNAVAAPIGPEANCALLRDARITPGLTHPVNTSARNRNLFALQPLMATYPVPAAAGAQMTWAEFLGFNNGTQWFQSIAPTFAFYCKHWKGSGNLASISPSNGQTGTLIVLSSAVYPTRDAHRQHDISQINTAGTLTSAASSITPPADKLAALTQTNWVPAANYGPNDNAGQIGHTRHGPWWNVAPMRYTSAYFDPSPTMRIILADKMHSERSTLDSITQ